jgi:dUTP pyrophosphatase
MSLSDFNFVVKIKRLPHALDLPLPSKMTVAASGYDLYAAVNEPTTLKPGQRVLVPCGFCLEMPEGLEAQVRPRSGLALKYGITTLNSPGTIDADYRGEIGVILIHHGNEDFVISRGDRIAQLVFQIVPSVILKETDTLTQSARGEGGFGHTGTKTDCFKENG